MKITYYGHSCVFIQTGGHRLLIDPFITGNPLAPIKASEIECDYILITHGHDDHVGDAGDIARRTGATIISNYEIACFFGEQGLKNHPMNHGGAWQFPFGRVKLTPAFHTSGYPGPDGRLLYMGEPAGIIISIEGKNVYHAGDTALFGDMKLIREMHPLEVAFLPIGDNFTMGINDAVKAVEFLRPRTTIPIHYNTFDLIKVDPEDFARKARTAGTTPVVLAPGQFIDL